MLRRWRPGFWRRRWWPSFLFSSEEVSNRWKNGGQRLKQGGQPSETYWIPEAIVTDLLKTIQPRIRNVVYIPQAVSYYHLSLSASISQIRFHNAGGAQPMGRGIVASIGIQRPRTFTSG